ncbi:Sensor protein ZraS [compost metagenome]
MNVQQTEICIAITDQGTGISETAIKEIFKPFYSSASESRHTGNGMGLYMAHKIITLYKGSITVNSKKGHGSTITVVFPKF